MSKIIKTLDDYPIQIKKVIRWGDMDAFQHVNNTKYFDYFEDVRIAYIFEHNGLDNLMSLSVGPILKNISAKYIRPVTYPDNLILGSRVLNIKSDRFDMEYAAYSEQQKTITTTGFSTIVFFDYKTHEKSPIPEPYKQRLTDLQPSLFNS